MFHSSKITASGGALFRCGIRTPTARNRFPSFNKDKCLETIFSDVDQARI